MTPDTGKRTAFKKNGGSDTGTIMDGIFLYIRNQWFTHITVLLYLSLYYSLYMILCVKLLFVKIYFKEHFVMRQLSYNQKKVLLP